MKWTIKQQEELKSRVNHWLDKLSMSPMTISYTFESKDYNRAFLEINTNYPYSSATIVAYPMYLKSESKDRLVVHELLHILIDEIDVRRLYSKVIYDDAVERAVDKLAHVIVDITKS